MHTFQVTIREVEFAGRQITADVVRDDGKVVRSGLWPDCAEAESALLNEYSANGWTAERYHAERAARMNVVCSNCNRVGHAWPVCPDLRFDAA